MGDATSKGTQSLSKIARLKGEVDAKIKVREVMVFVRIITGLWQNKPSFIAYPNRKEKNSSFLPFSLTQEDLDDNIRALCKR
ncbi:hypothetical protein TUMSATVNIG1_10370 [Vibrio nigripulchritudo]|nr:hypothetical protein TUMSATVNIG1_10370 [Vibrio nigripulchritudo]